MMYGYAGNILRVNLSSGRITKEALKEELASEYIGGRGFTAKILYDENPPGIEPFHEDNRFIIATGPLNGLFLPASGKTHFCSKSPVTGGYGDSNMGGHFGVAMKYAGYDIAILQGRAKTPSYLFIDDDRIEIRSAQAYWTRGSTEVEAQMKMDLGEDFQILTIGPAGENLVNFACISHDFGRQAGRLGIGAVLGSKNIKAIAVRGTKDIPVFDPKGLLKKGKEAYQACRERPGFLDWTPEGTAGITNWCNDIGVLPTKNFQTSNCDYADKINGKSIVSELKITDKACFSCPIPCGKYGHAKTALGDAYVEGPEYETLALLGSNCELDDIHGIAYANFICDELGLDTCSSGVVVGFALECYEKGMISHEEMGMDVKWGDLASIVHILKQISAREGIGDTLALGVRDASRKIGKGSEEFAIHVKGVEWTAYESRNAPGMMLGYLTSDIGAHHGRCWVLGQDLASAVGSGSGGTVFDMVSGGASFDQIPKASHEGVAPIVIKSQHLRPTFDILGTCRFQYLELGLELENYEQFYYHATGKTLDYENDLIRLSEKIWHLNRMFNKREISDFGRKYDYPPARFYKEKIPTGPNKGHKIHLNVIEQMLDDYYKERGWDENGIPTPETLEKFNLKIPPNS